MADDGQWADVTTAARALGVSPDAVRGRCQRGSIRAEKDAGGEWRVWIPDGTRPTGTQATAADLTAELVTELRREIARLESECGEWRRRHDDLQGALLALTGRLLPPPDAERRDDQDGPARAWWMFWR